MTAKEARNKAIWYRINPNIRRVIEDAVHSGKTTVDLTMFPMDNKSRSALGFLGYRYNAPGTIISW